MNFSCINLYSKPGHHNAKNNFTVIAKMVDLMNIRKYNDKIEMGRMAAYYSAGIIKRTVSQKGKARIILATGASQFCFLDSLVGLPLPWDKVTCFHLDEYVGLPISHPASFRNYLQERVWSKVTPKMCQVHKLDPDKIDEYEKLLLEDDIDLACIGIGENGHIAFNDPPVADFNDQKMVKIVELDEACRKQQVGEGWFESLDKTPTKAATLTIPAILRSKAISVVVPDARKAEAVKNTLIGSIGTHCPASILRRHNNTILWVDANAFSLYQAETERPSIPDGDLEFPGLVDIQVNGYKGINFSDPSLTEEDFKKTCHSILNEFAFMFVPTIISSPLEVYKNNLPLISKVIDEDPLLKSRIPGIHLEGPFLSTKDGANGCHELKNLLLPDVKMLDEWQRLAQGKIIILTMAAELDGAEEFAYYASGLGIKVCLGHQLAGKST